MILFDDDVVRSGPLWIAVTMRPWLNMMLKKCREQMQKATNTEASKGNRQAPVYLYHHKEQRFSHHSLNMAQ